jgi:radical SAM protein with 4Fe4S-binding SPASM domain
LQEYIEILLDRGIVPWIFTNMVGITPRFAKWLFERAVYITGKLNIDPRERTQIPLQADLLGSSIRGAEKMIEAIEVFLDAGYRDPLFRLQNLVRKTNIGFVPDYYSYCLSREIGTDLELMASGEKIDSKYWAIAPSPEDIVQMIVQVQGVRTRFNLPPADVLMPHVFGSCPFYDKGLYFAVDGHIRACSNSTVKLSHVNDSEPIRMAYESPLICRRKSLRQELVGEPCHSCNKWEKCRGGCRATVEGIGDPFGGYPLCPVPYL